VINQVTKQDGTIAFVRNSIVNNIIEDTLFIKILPLLVTSSDDFEGTNINSAIGVTVQWRITNLNGDKTISLLNQKFQWNYGSLQLPFVTVGLGRTNNYIEDLTVGYPGYG
jgi:integrin alpha FG-GAP repeat containing protein 1